MSLLAEAKTLVTERYPLVFAVTLLGVTALIQAPRIAEFGVLAQEASVNKDKSIKSQATQASMHLSFSSFPAAQSRSEPNAFR